MIAKREQKGGKHNANWGTAEALLAFLLTVLRAGFYIYWNYLLTV